MQREIFRNGACGCSQHLITKSCWATSLSSSSSLRTSTEVAVVLRRPSASACAFLRVDDAESGLGSRPKDDGGV